MKRIIKSMDYGKYDYPLKIVEKAEVQGDICESLYGLFLSSGIFGKSK